MKLQTSATNIILSEFLLTMVWMIRALSYHFAHHVCFFIMRKCNVLVLFLFCVLFMCSDQLFIFGMSPTWWLCSSSCRIVCIGLTLCFMRLMLKVFPAISIWKVGSWVKLCAFFNNHFPLIQPEMFVFFHHHVLWILFTFVHCSLQDKSIST